MEVIQVVPDRPACQSFSVAGRLLFVESSDLALHNLIVRLFAGWQLTSVSCPDGPPDIQIQFRCGDVSQAVPPNLNHFETAEGGRCYTDGPDFYLVLDGAMVQLANGPPLTLTVSVKALPGAGDPLLGRAASFAVCAGLRRFGLFDLHSAGVVEPESGRGVVIVGPSGSGKSTLALQLALSGWPYLSDDELLLSLVNDTVEARGFRSFFALPTTKDAPFKHCFEPDTTFGSQKMERAVPGSLFFIRRSGEAESKFSKLTQAETMTRLIRSCPWATYDTSIAGANLEVLSALARQARGFDLSAGRDLLEPGFAAELLRNCLEP